MAEGTTDETIESLKKQIQSALGYTDADRSRFDRIRSARRDAATCAKCGGPTVQGAPVWRTNIWLGTRYEIAPVCETCADKWVRADCWSRVTPCKKCGRPVYEIKSGRHTKVVCCSTACRSQCHRLHHGAKAKADRTAKRKPRACAGCGNQLTNPVAGKFRNLPDK